MCKAPCVGMRDCLGVPGQAACWDMSVYCLGVIGAGILPRKFFCLNIHNPWQMSMSHGQRAPPTTWGRRDHA
eukprot:5167150-Pyramimonas_sp.AAC.1